MAGWSSAMNPDRTFGLVQMHPSLGHNSTLGGRKAEEVHTAEISIPLDFGLAGRSRRLTAPARDSKF